MIVTQHYLYYLDADGAGMILIRYEPQPNGEAISEWISHQFVSDYNPPLLLSLQETATILSQEEWSHFEVQVGDWVGIKRCRDNVHKVN